ncbi:tRNA pseudouridine(38-40) synthase TruA [Fundidesulfovibrio soli]|uniref:tRNA pseudouridine(38-40) synthase TruA n=1 Tax=Fundidesulfovibrio soli TaxID=2922716 RepID=UPI001FAE92D2|nr:tRNA pseudouridine(38-40) synthase TruA [Fundidesulfovibrio soli]
MTKDTIRLKFTLAYQGTEFAGWQLQPEGQGRSVQGCLEQALEQLCGQFVRVHGASRTDSGVHALGQHAHADIPADRAHLPFRRALNALLPRDVSVLGVERVPADFHCRIHSVRKFYAYTLWHEAEFILPQRRPFVWRVGRLDTRAMLEAASLLIGTHDFAGFQNTGTPVRDTVRTVESIAPHPGQTPQETVWRVTGPGFLKQMVRNIMGCLVEVGRGKANADFVRSLLVEKDRSLAPATAPAKGLCLEGMEFAYRERCEDQSRAGAERPELDPGEESLGHEGGAAPRG